ncbi:MAG: NUDIX domain-containing protein [Candidatus Diapherotrites archaeon]|uniref:NUDIX domain-containing protein n=1 Tax=Candidatus Iainarchaeum sp. TaxID=3101447 RepID=A0A8T3YLB8_9ARCH|nr:NUDIX domain-containing protein [Candidatus Diapherotrites archaeon]
MEEILDVINEKNEVIRQAPRSEVEAKGLLYRTAEIIVFMEGKIAIQKRAANKTKRPSHYSIVGETVKAGETFEEAAVRGVREELGLEARNLRKIGDKIVHDELYTDNMLMRLFTCEGEGRMEIDEGEVKEVKMLSVEEVQGLIASGVKVTPCLVEGLRMYKEAIR